MTKAIAATLVQITWLIFQIVLIFLGFYMIGLACYHAMFDHNYAHACYDILCGGLCLGWFKSK